MAKTPDWNGIPSLPGVQWGNMNPQAFGSATQMQGQKYGAMGPMGSTIYSQPANFADALSKNYAAYSAPYASESSSYYGGMSGLGKSYADLYGQGVGSMGAIGANGANAMGSAAGSAAGAMGTGYGAIAGAQGQLGAANQAGLSGLYGTANNSLASIYGSGATARAARDQSLLSGLAGLGGAGVTAIGNLGSATAASLANQSIAAANGYGQMANANYNMMGQLGTALAGIATAREAAGPQYAKINFAAGALPSILDTAKYGMQMGPYTAGNMNMPSMGGSGYGDGGFSASGPGGPVAAGSWNNQGGGYSSPSGGGPFNAPPPPGQTGPIAGGAGSPGDGMAATTSFFNDIRKQMEKPDSMANKYRQDMGAHFDANRAATMDPRFLASVNNMVGGGYGAMLLAGSGDYSPDAAMVQVADLTRSGADDMRSGLRSSMDGLGSLAGQVGGIPQGVLGSLSSGIGDLMGNANSYMSPMLQKGGGALNGLAGDMRSAHNQFAGDIGSAFNSTNANTQDLFGSTLGKYQWGGSLGDMFNTSPMASDDSRDPLEGLNQYDRSRAANLATDVRRARANGDTAAADRALQQYRGLTAPIL